MATLTETQKLQGEINKYSQSTSDPTTLHLMSMKFTSLHGIVFNSNVKNIYIGGANNAITTLDDVQFPPDLKMLRIHSCPIHSMNNVKFPVNLEELSVTGSQLTTLEGVTFPPKISILNLNGNKITSLKGIVFPNTLYQLYLDDNQITSFDGMKFPFGLSGLSIKNNPIVIDTIRLLVRPTEVVMRAIVLSYPQTAAYFEAQGEIKELNMRNLQNHVRSIAAFLQPLIAERNAKEEANLTRGKPVLFVVNSFNGTRYSIPFVASQTVQTAIDYLEQNYLLSVTNSYAKIRLTKSSDNTVLDPSRTFADMNINNEDTVNVISDNSTAQAVQISRGGRIQNKTKRKRSRSRRYN